MGWTILGWTVLWWTVLDRSQPDEIPVVSLRVRITIWSDLCSSTNELFSIALSSSSLKMERCCFLAGTTVWLVITGELGVEFIVIVGVLTIVLAGELLCAWSTDSTLPCGYQVITQCYLGIGALWFDSPSVASLVPVESRCCEWHWPWRNCS